MKNYWSTSDWHFMHRKMLEQLWDDRPVDYMSLILERYAERVLVGDEVWFLGDMLFQPHKTKDWFSHIMRDLPGAKFLVRGNHDCHKRTPDQYWIEECGFIEVHEYFAVKEGILLSHFPMVPASTRGDDRYLYETLLLHDEYKERELLVNLHGHTHTYHSDSPVCVNVGVDVHNFEPMSINALLLLNKTEC